MNRYARPSNFASRIRTPLLREHFVYRAYDAAGDLLYVGCSMGVEKRLSEHKMGRWHHLMKSLKIVGPFNYETAREIEHEAIESERPQFNFTSDHRKVKNIHSRMVDREWAHQQADGTPWTEALTAACAVIDDIFPSPKYIRMSPEFVAMALRLEASHAAGLDRAAS